MTKKRKWPERLTTEKATINNETVTAETTWSGKNKYRFEIKHADLVVDHGEGFDDNWRVYVAAKQAWKAYLATLLEQIQCDEPLAGGKQRGHWKASIESYTEISAAEGAGGRQFQSKMFEPDFERHSGRSSKGGS